MSQDQTDISYEKEVPPDAPDEGELQLLDEDDQELEQDSSDEAVAEAGMSDTGGPETESEDVEFEEEEASADEAAGLEHGGAFPLHWMAGAFRKNGLRVQEVKGWRARGRPGSFAPRAAMFHHTASSARGGNAPSLGICTRGRSDLPGPLCHVLIGRDSTVYVIAAGRASHAGSGGPWRNVPRDSGNSFSAGVEVENDGVGEPWKPQLLHTCDVVFATLLMHLGRRAGWLLGHKEWARGRKSDPARIDMNKYRERVRAEIRRIASRR